MNPERLLIDTSAWILGFKKSGPEELKNLLRVAVLDGNAVTSPPIILELIQGCRNEEERTALRARLESLDRLPVNNDVCERTYDLGFSLRRKGAVVPTVDIIVAVVAMEHGCTIVHSDRHFEMICTHNPFQ